MNQFFEITVGGAGPYDPVAGATEVNISILAGIGGYVEKRNVGKLSTSAYTVLSNGGFSVVTPFANGEVYFFIPDYFGNNTATGNYSNGFNYSRVMSAMIPRLGWKQSPDNAVDSSNLISLSGRYFNDGSFHPTVTLSNIKSSFGTGAFANNTQLNAELLQIKKAAIISALTSVFNESELIERKMLFDRCGNNDLEIPSAGKFVGVRFKIAGDKYALKINSIQLYFNEEVTFNLYIFHDTQTAPIWQQSVTTEAGATVAIPLSSELILNYLGTNYSTGHFYLGYFQTDLGTAKAVDEEKHISKKFCFGAEFFQADKVGTSFNKKQISCSSQTFGINADVTVLRDHTESIIRQAYLFDNAIGLQVAYNVVKQFIYSNRRNQDERMAKDVMGENVILSYEMEGAAPAMGVAKTSGLQTRISEELKRLRQSFFPKQKSKVVELC